MLVLFALIMSNNLGLLLQEFLELLIVSLQGGFSLPKHLQLFVKDQDCFVLGDVHLILKLLELGHDAGLSLNGSNFRKDMALSVVPFRF